MLDHLKSIAGVALAAVMLLSPSALAGEVRPWSADGFAAAQAAGAPIVIHVTAPWCPTCRAQKPTVEGLAADPGHPDLTVFDVDFDTQKDVLRKFGVRQQSTLIAYRGATEVARTVGVTRPEAIAELFAATR